LLLADISVQKHSHFLIIFWNIGVRLAFFLITNFLLWELKLGYEKESILARTDGLTGAINQRFFRHLLQSEIERAYRYNHPFTLVYFDVDNFKQVNNTLGHSKGDYLLKLITEIIQVNIRQTDSLSRLGGDEFALLLPETDYEPAQIVLQRIQIQLLEMVNLQQFPISFSMGAITYLTVPDSVDKALEQVDTLMYTVKNSGKNGLKHKIMNYEL
jgi:diguanylate cyclase (GGDEF)-like protein